MNMNRKEAKDYILNEIHNADSQTSILKVIAKILVEIENDLDYIAFHKWDE